MSSPVDNLPQPIRVRHSWWRSVRVGQAVDVCVGQAVDVRVGQAVDVRVERVIDA